MNYLGAASLILILSILVYSMSRNVGVRPLEKILTFLECIGFVMLVSTGFVLNMIAMHWLYSVLFIGTMMTGQ
jgi:hypothetical protein